MLPPRVVLGTAYYPEYLPRDAGDRIAADLDLMAAAGFSFDDVQGRGQPYLGSSTWLAPLYTDVDRYVGRLNRLLALDFDALVPSHGDVLDSDAGRKRITESLEWVAEVEAHTVKLLRAKGSLTVRELATAIGTDLGNYGGINLQTVRMARAHLEHLARRGELEPRWHRRG